MTSHKTVLIGKKSINCILISIEQLNGKTGNVSALNMRKNTIYANSGSGAHSCAFVNKTDRNFDSGNNANENRLEYENSGESQTFANSSEKIIPLNSGHSESEVINKLDMNATVKSICICSETLRPVACFACDGLETPIADLNKNESKTLELKSETCVKSDNKIKEKKVINKENIHSAFDIELNPLTLTRCVS